MKICERQTNDTSMKECMFGRNTRGAQIKRGHGATAWGDKWMRHNEKDGGKTDG